MRFRSEFSLLAGLASALCMSLPVVASEAQEKATETTLKLPQSADEMREYMASGNSRCPGCGVVSNVRQVEAEVLGGRTPDAGVDMRTGDSGPGEEIHTVTLAGTGSASREARQRAAMPPAKPWRVTVRYDDGSYASFDQDDRPRVARGQRVQVVSGRVEAR